MNEAALEKAAIELYNAMYAGSPTVKFGALASAHKMYWKRLAAHIVATYLRAADEWHEVDRTSEGSPKELRHNTDKAERLHKQAEMQKKNIGGH